MVIEIRVPDIGAGEVETTEILVKAGDKVEAGQLLVTVEGDKTSMEVPAPFAGAVKEIKVGVGDKVFTDSLVMIFGVASEAGAAAPAAKQEAAPAATPASAAGMEKVNIPDIGGDEVEVAKAVVKVGDKVAVEQSLIIVEDDKASMEAPVPFIGVVRELKINVDGRVKTGSLIMIFEAEGVAPVATPTKQEAAASAPAAKVEAPAATPTARTEGKSESAENGAHVHAIPLICRLTREFGVNPAKVKGTGCKGRTLHEGVQACVKEAIKCVEAAPAATDDGTPGILPWPKVDFSKFGEIEEVELDRIQEIFGANLSRNWMMTPHATHFDKTDTTEPETSHKQQSKEAAKHKLDVKITPVVFTMKAAVAALEQMSRFSSSLSEDGQCLTLKKYTNIDVAVDTPNGLVVPMFKGVNKRGIIELSCELMTISKKTRDGKLTAGEVQGGCFTISSTGGLGTARFAPIVNAPEATILGISKSVMKPVWNGKEFMPRLMLPIPLSFDHHVIDGAGSTHFTTIINDTLSDVHCLMM